MTSERRANDNDPKAPGYELGDLEIMPTGRSSGAHAPVNAPVPRAAPAAATRQSHTGLPAASGVAAKPSPSRGMPRNLTLADGDLGPALELDFAAAPEAARRASQPENRTSPVPRAASLPTASSGAARPALPPSAGAANAAAALASFGTADVLDDFDEGFAKLPTLEVETIERRSAERVVAREAVPDEAVTKEREEAEAIRNLARFNDAPDGLLASVQYAFHVTMRVLALRKERAAAVQQQKLRAEELQAAQVSFGQALMAKAADKRLEPLRTKIAHVQDERAKVERADQGIERTREGNERALGLMRSEAEHLKEELEPYAAAERQALEEQRKADAEVRRAQAMHKRVDIELRALEAATLVDPARLDALHAQLDQRQAAVEAVSGTLAQANEALGKARRDLALKRGTLDQNQEKQKQLEAESRARELAAEGQKKAAHGSYEAALCELSETARKLKLAALAPEQATKVDASERALEAAGYVIVRFDRALELFDRKTAIKGFTLVAALIGLAVLAFVLR